MAVRGAGAAGAGIETRGNLAHAVRPGEDFKAPKIYLVKGILALAHGVVSCTEGSVSSRGGKHSVGGLTDYHVP